MFLKHFLAYQWPPYPQSTPYILDGPHGRFGGGQARTASFKRHQGLFLISSLSPN
ncbi:hypothetical protein AB205_0136130 [Aquarana catesbeiana]|uniref:Uncharacterized protein n=1 Tax=Aquarana catesbeiana TaxID=8400 RepID=A0A2G9RRW2_AQUCT|nr:hypothetical protein AB205_0136130 [Aquarana catesbeiana]